MKPRAQPTDTSAVSAAELPDEDDPGASDAECRAAVVDAVGHGKRLDLWLVQLVPEFSRSYLQKLIDAGHARVDGRALTTASRKLTLGQRVEIDLVPTPESRAFVAEPMDLDVVFEDEHLMVVNKPAGLVVHPAAGNWSGTLLNGLLAWHAGAAALPRAGIVHRLDKDTSGLMVVGKTLAATTGLVRAIAAREVHRQYVAICEGRVAADEFSVDAPLGRDPASRLRMAVVASGKTARTDVKVLARCEERGAQRSVWYSAVQCILHTGRTHQIRVHLASKGHPLVADAVYGGQPALGLTRQALHALRLAFAHPVSGAAIDLHAALPADLAAAWMRVAPGVAP